MGLSGLAHVDSVARQTPVPLFRDPMDIHTCGVGGHQGMHQLNMNVCTYMYGSSLRYPYIKIHYGIPMQRFLKDCPYHTFRDIFGHGREASIVQFAESVYKFRNAICQ